MTFQLTHKATPFTAEEKALKVTLRDDLTIGSMIAVGALADQGDFGRQHTGTITRERAIEILTGAGYTAPQMVMLQDMVALLTSEGLLDQFDDSRQEPEA